MTPKPLKILLIEDDELFRLGISTRLHQEAGLEIVAEAEDGETAIELASQLPLDIVILDVGLPGIGGVEACRQIKQRRPSLPVLVLTSHSQKILITQLIQAKANGYCLKGIAAENLILAIRSVACGASWWDSNATVEIQMAFQSSQSNLNSISNSTITSSFDNNSLTKREREILTLVVAGKSNQEIGENLFITSGTVRVHIHAILQKLEVRDRTQAAIIAIQRGLIDCKQIENN
ncbi:MAG: response regulator transcription factor [Nostocales cyanobacterium 94392]|nr:response regulator transcription factor [Nostocales cyanobacterium 94392]